MFIDDEKALKMMIEIMEIKDEPENIKELKAWIEREGIETVFQKVHDMYKIYL